jgi:hypothetical protein
LTEQTHCDGASYAIINSTNCVIPLYVLTAAPFNLVLGNSIQVQIVAVNQFGNSSSSVVGSGVNVVVVPDAPINI